MTKRPRKNFRDILRKRTLQPAPDQSHQECRPMLREIRVRALRAVEEVLVLVILHLRGRGVAVRVRHLGLSAELSGADGVPLVHEDGDGRGGEDVAW